MKLLKIALKILWKANNLVKSGITQLLYSMELNLSQIILLLLET